MRQKYNLSEPPAEDRFRAPDSPLSITVVTYAWTIWAVGLASTIMVMKVLLCRLGKAKSKVSKTYDYLLMVETIADLLSIAIFDILVFARQGFGIDLEISYTLFCKFFSGLFCFTYGLSTDIIVLMSTMRFLVVYHPFIFQNIINSQKLTVICILMVILATIPFALFIAIRSVHSIYRNGYQFNSCGLHSGNKIYRSITYLTFGILHIFFPAVINVIFMAFGYFKMTKNPSMKTDKKQKRAVSALHNNAVAAITLLQGFPVCGLFLYDILVFSGSVQIRQTIIDFATLIALTPRCLKYWIFSLFSSNFRAGRRKAKGQSSHLRSLLLMKPLRSLKHHYQQACLPRPASKSMVKQETVAEPESDVESGESAKSKDSLYLEGRSSTDKSKNSELTNE